MSYSIYVLCTEAEPVTRREVAEFIEEGSYFDEVSFEPSPASADALDPYWDYLMVCYDRDPQPVVVRRMTGVALQDLAAVVEGTFYEQDVEMPAAVASHVAALAQAFELQFHRGGNISEDCWAMMDCLEAHLARSRGGIVFSPDDGIYDADLKSIVTW